MLTKLSFFLEKILNFFPPLKKSHSSLLKHYHNDDLHLSIIFFVSFKLLKNYHHDHLHLLSPPSFLSSACRLFLLTFQTMRFLILHLIIVMTTTVFIIHMAAMIVMIIQLILFIVLQL